MSTTDVSADRDIALAGPCTARDRAGTVWNITSITVSAQDYCCDVVVHVPHGPYSLCDDEVFLGEVHAALARAGYNGPRLGRAELGMQGDGRIALEASEALQDFAMERGWRYADGTEELICGRLLRTFGWNTVVAFRASNKAVYGVPVEFIARNHAEAHLTKFGGTLSRSLAEGTIPLFQSNPDAIVQWLEQMPFSLVEPLIRELEGPPEVDLRKEFELATRKTVRGLKQS